MVTKNRLSFILFFLLLFIIPDDLISEFGPWNTKLVKVERHKTLIENNIDTPRWVLIRFVRFFQVVISPQDGPNCRYTPTCSQYGLISIRDYGPILGLIMAADRFMRCNPLGAWGKDLPSDNYFFDNHHNKK